MQLSALLSLSRDFLDRSHNLKKSDISPLREAIIEHNRLYYRDEAPIISDTEYDELFHALARLEADHHMLDAWSPTARLAILASSQFRKVQHQYPMISLDNTYSIEEVREWNQRMLRILEKGDKWQTTSDNTQPPKENTQSATINPLLDFFIQPKYDGLGLALIYEYGKITQAITRWNGFEGEDVTLTALEIQNLPKYIELLQKVERMEIRGEVMLSRTEFERINHQRWEMGEKLFANPRNCASWSLRQLDPLITRERNLHFFAYSIPQIEQSRDLWDVWDVALQDGKNWEMPSITKEKYSRHTYSEMMEVLSLWGFERADFDFFQAKGIDKLCEILEGVTAFVTGRWSASSTWVKKTEFYFDFDIDGIVLKVDDMTLWDILGRTEHHPRYAIAYKFPAKQVRTKVISIEHSVWRTGTITPVANLEPVEVTGVIVKRATLHNYDELQKKWVREGDFVFVMRAWEVIPEIVSVLTELRNGNEKMIEAPQKCPVCSTETRQDAGMTAIYCPNPHCPARTQWKLEMFVSKQGMNIDGLWTKQIELFLELGWITDFSSIFDLWQYREKFLSIEGYKEKSINNLLESLEKSRHTTLDRLLVALGVPHVGKKTARMIMNYIIWMIHTTWQSLSEVLFGTREDALLNMKDIWPETANAFVEYMTENKSMVEKLLTKLDIDTGGKALSASEWLQHISQIFGKSFCVTGSFAHISREKIHEIIEKHGGEVRTSVSAKLDYLIVGENSGSKKIKAEELGVKCLDFDEFLSLTS